MGGVYCKFCNRFMAAIPGRVVKHLVCRMCQQNWYRKRGDKLEKKNTKDTQREDFLEG